MFRSWWRPPALNSWSDRGPCLLQDFGEDLVSGSQVKAPNMLSSLVSPTAETLILCTLCPSDLLRNIIHTHPFRSSTHHIYILFLVHWWYHLVKISIKILSHVLLWRHNYFGLRFLILISQFLSKTQQVLHNRAVLLMRDSSDQGQPPLTGGHSEWPPLGHSYCHHSTVISLHSGISTCPGKIRDAESLSKAWSSGWVTHPPWPVPYRHPSHSFSAGRLLLSHVWNFMTVW